MNINIQNLLKYLIILNILSFLNISYVEGEILPLKKPSLSKEVKKSKEIQNILKPLKKPLLKTEDSINKGELENKKTKKTNIEFLIPKSKPLIVKKEKKKIDKKSKYFKQRDFDLAYRAIQAFEKGKWIESIRIAKKAKDKSIYKFVQWKYLLTVNNQASFYDYKNFIDENNDFPRISRLKFLAEHKLSTKKISHKKIIQWFENEEPLSGYGKIILGESFILSGETQKGINILKDGWITAKLSRSEMKVFRKKFKKYLNTDDYIKRADYLAWENKYWDLKRMLRYLPKDYQLLYTARQLLMSKSYGVDNAISKVPPKFKNDPGLNYDRLKWRRKRGRVDSSLEILLKIPNTKNYMIRPDKWWKERLILSRSLLYKNIIAHSTVMYRKKLIDLIGKYPKKYLYAQDYAFYLKVFKRFNITTLKSALVDIREPHKNSETFRRSKSRLITLEEIKLLIWSFKNFNLIFKEKVFLSYALLKKILKLI